MIANKAVMLPVKRQVKPPRFHEQSDRVLDQLYLAFIYRYTRLLLRVHVWIMPPRAAVSIIYSPPVTSHSKALLKVLFSLLPLLLASLQALVPVNLDIMCNLQQIMNDAYESK